MSSRESRAWASRPGSTGRPPLRRRPSLPRCLGRLGGASFALALAVVDLLLVVAVPALLFVIARQLLRFGHPPELSWALAAAAVVVVALLSATLRPGRRGSHGRPARPRRAVADSLGDPPARDGCRRSLGRARDRPGRRKARPRLGDPAGARGNLVLVEGSAAPEGAAEVLYLRDLAAGTERVLPMSQESAASADGSRVAMVTVRSTLKASRLVELEVIDTARGDLVVLDLPRLPRGNGPLVRRPPPRGRRSGSSARSSSSPSLQLLASARVPFRRSVGVRALLRLFPTGCRIHPFRMTYRESGEPGARTSRTPWRPRSTSARNPCRRSATTRSARFRSSRWSRPGAPDRAVLPAPRPVRISPASSSRRVGAARSVRLLDASWGVSSRLSTARSISEYATCFLADGRAVVAEWVPDGRRLVVLSPDGERLARSVSLPRRVGSCSATSPHPTSSPSVSGIPARRRSGPGRSPIWARGAGHRSRSTPSSQRPFWFSSSSPPVPGSPATRLGRERGTLRLVLDDPVTGETRPLTRACWPAGK